MNTAPNPEFALERELKSCVVTRDFLDQLESQLKTLESDVFGGMPIQTRKYELSVIDAFGIETFGSAADIPMRGFPESTDTVRIVLETRTVEAADGQAAECSIRVKLAFRRAFGNRLSLRVRGPSARERALGFVARLEQLHEPQVIDAWLFRWRESLLSLIAGVAFLGGLIWLAMTYDALKSKPATFAGSAYWITTSVVATAGAYLAIIKYFYPRCAFETTRWQRRERWRNWAAQGFAALLLFNLLLATLGKRLLTLLLK